MSKKTTTILALIIVIATAATISIISKNFCEQTLENNSNAFNPYEHVSHSYNNGEITIQYLNLGNSAELLESQNVNWYLNDQHKGKVYSLSDADEPIMWNINEILTIKIKSNGIKNGDKIKITFPSGFQDIFYIGGE